MSATASCCKSPRKRCWRSSLWRNAACHGPEGAGNGPLAANFLRPPANLTKGPFIWTIAGDALDLRVARVIKFGIPGVDMPGHETLRDSEVLALTQHVLRLRN